MHNSQQPSDDCELCIIDVYEKNLNLILPSVFPLRMG